ncbi:MAG: PTS sugar transporter subunit IIB [Angelakisella sp.]
MANINLTRVDNRLIHGQVATNWLRNYDVNICIVVNDRVSNDAMEQKLLSMAIANLMPVRFFSVEKTIELLKTADPRRKIALIVENPIDVWKLVDGGVELKQCNIGNMHMADGKEKLFKTVYVSKEEKEAIAKLVAKGVNVEYRLLPTDNAVDFKTVI